MSSKTFRVDNLARVEGEGALYVRVRDGRVREVRLRIFEPPRFFEAFLKGRQASEVPDLTARICGICPVAYQMSSVHAVEAAFGIHVGGDLRDLRRLLYCAEWIESHALHVYMLHAPDFLGYESGIHMARDHRAIVERGLRLKKIGNRLMACVGGREIHPINVRVGGFYRAPARDELLAHAEDLRWAVDAAEETVRWVAGFDFPDFERDYEMVSLAHPEEYPLNEGRIVSNRGLDIPASAFEDVFEERHVFHSTALHSVVRERGSYLVGPLARFNHNAARLTPRARAAAAAAGLAVPCRNPFRSIVARAVETLFACEESLRIVEGYERPEVAAVRVEPREGVGHACTEAPRGILYHRYKLDVDGVIREARIVPPTSQNQKCIEDDLRDFVQRHLDLPDLELRNACEQAVRNFDPCISCSTHFLTLDMDRA